MRTNDKRMLALLLVLLMVIGYNERTEKENQKTLKAQADSVNAKKRVNGKLPITRPLASFNKLSHNEEGK